MPLERERDKHLLSENRLKERRSAGHSEVKPAGRKCHRASVPLVECLVFVVSTRVSIVKEVDKVWWRGTQNIFVACTHNKCVATAALLKDCTYVVVYHSCRLSFASGVCFESAIQPSHVFVEHWLSNTLTSQGVLLAPVQCHRLGVVCSMQLNPGQFRFYTGALAGH